MAEEQNGGTDGRSMQNVTLRLEDAVIARADAVRDRLAGPPLRIDLTRTAVIKSAALSGLDQLEAQYLGTVRDETEAERASATAAVRQIEAAYDAVMETEPLTDQRRSDMHIRLFDILRTFRAAVLTGRSDA